MATKILMILTNLNHSDGIATFCMNYYSRMNHDEFKVDFVIHTKPSDAFLSAIEANGDHVFVMPYFSTKTLLKINKRAKKIIKEGHYDIVHCHLPNAAFIYLRQARKNHVPVRISHAHFTEFSDVARAAKRNKMLWDFAKKDVNVHFACSNVAGDFLYGKKDYTVIPNSVDYGRFAFSESARAEIRTELGLSEKDKLLCLIGRVAPQKNNLFAVKLMKKLPMDYHLVLIGSQNYPEYLDECIKAAEGDSRIHILKPRVDVEKFYSAADLLLLPSYYEGLPLTLVEGQANGLYCLSSNLVTDEVSFGGVSFLPLKKEEWIEAILSAEPRRSEPYYSESYDSSKAIRFLEQTYLESVKKHKHD